MSIEVQDDDDDAAEDKAEPKEEELLEQIRERYKLVTSEGQEQRDNETEDLRYQVPKFQWSDRERAAREGDQVKTSGRPCLSISLIDQPRQLILNQMRSADLGIEVHPVSEDADPDNAEMRQGLYRAIERDGAQNARYWAFDRAVTAGRGAYRVLTEYDPEGGKPGDQKIVIRRIRHQEGVFFDPAANEPDFRDGRFAFVISWLPRSEFKRKYPKAKVATSEGLALEGYERIAPEWFKPKDCVVAEYWYRVVKTRKNRADEVKVYCAYTNGVELLGETQTWPGTLIPLIPTIGRELLPFDDQRRFFGIVRPARDAQKMHNHAMSSVVEAMAKERMPPWIGTAEQFAGYESDYAEANVTNAAFLRYKPAMVAGQMLPPPQRAQIDQSSMSIALQVAQQASSAVQAATAVFDPSLGNVPQKDRSGRAIQALQGQTDAGTSHYLSSFTEVSLPLEADIINEVMPFVYDRPGRIIRIVKGDDKKSEPVMINRPYIMDPKTRRPIPAPPQRSLPPGPGALGAPPLAPSSPGPAPAGMPPGPGGLVPPPQPPPPQPEVKHYDLSKGSYGITITVGKAYQSRLDAGREFLSGLLTDQPALVPIIGDLVFKFRDDPGAQEVSKRLAKMREQMHPGLSDDDSGMPNPEAMKAQVSGLQQKTQEMGQALQQAVQQLQSKQMETEARVKVAEIAAQAKLMQAQADNETKLAIAGLQAQFAGFAEKVTLALQHQHEQRNAMADKFHDAASQGREHAHEAAMAQLDAAQQMEQRKHEVAMGQLNEPGPEQPEAPEPTAMPEGGGE